MTHYECCYSSGRQFVFAEQRRWVFAGLAAVAICGLILGLSIGVTISLTGVFIFEVLMVALACLSAHQAYMSMFQRVSSSVDIWSYIFGNTASLALFAALLAVTRLSLQLNLDLVSRSALFSLVGLLMGVVLYVYVRLCLQEDERKHHLGLCAQDGQALDQPLSTAQKSSSGGGFPAEGEAQQGFIREDFVRFVIWVFTWRWWLDLNFPEPLADEECNSADTIVVHNHTLKLVKVCFYSPDDLFCWVPFGGISGHGVGFVQAEDCRAFRLRRQQSAGGEGAKGRCYQLKVFQPGFLDKELACCSRARCGQSFAFSDVEGMMKRSRVLSLRAAKAKPAPAGPSAALGSALVSESSEDDLAAALVRGGGLGQQLRVGGGSGELLRRSTRVGSFHLALAGQGGSGLSAGSAGGAEEGSSPSLVARGRPSIEARRAGADEIVVRNRSNQEIRARLFRTNDYCFMVPLVSRSCSSFLGEMLGCGDCIQPHEELRLNPKSELGSEFTLKVYSVGSGAKELTYLTVSRGNTYMFCDSLLS